MRIAQVVIRNYRRLQNVTIELDKKTTVFVGANNSGKTAAISAMALFLRSQTEPSRQQRLTIADIHAAGQEKLNELGQKWLASGEQESSDELDPLDEWSSDLKSLGDVFPCLDLCLSVTESELHLVSDLIPRLTWTPSDPMWVRIRPELAEDALALKTYVHRYRSIWREIHGTNFDLPKAWPRNFVDYLSRDLIEHPPAFSTWVLDPHRGALLRRVAGAALGRILRVDVIAAQRGLGGEEAALGGSTGDARIPGGLFTRRLVSYCGKNLKSSTEAREAQTVLGSYIAQAEAALDQGLKEALEESMEEMKALGYPGVRDPELVLKSRIASEQLLDHDASVQYRTGGPNGVFLPEHSIGLGYQNLLMLSFTLIQLRKARCPEPENPEDEVPAIHLVLAEEPEAHLHVQVQRAFVEKARGFIQKDGDETKGRTAQLVISTHSSHIAHAVPFSQVRYFRRQQGTEGFPTAHVINLCDTFGTELGTLRFVERYLQVQHSDLFFADAAILIEGAAERVLLPLFIKDHPTPPGGESLSRSLITILPVGGAHAHRLRPLIEVLGLTTLVITDLDPTHPIKKPTGSKTDSGESNEEKRKPKSKASVRRGSDQRTTNPTLSGWLPGTKEVKDLLSYGDGSTPDKRTDRHVRVAYQVSEEQGAPRCGATFEDALIMANEDWFRKLANPSSAGKAEVLPRALQSTVDELNSEPEDLPDRLLAMLDRSSFGKAEFALDLFMKYDPEAPPWLKCPRYIREGLDWLSSELGRVDNANTVEPAPGTPAIPDPSPHERAAPRKKVPAGGGVSA